MGIYVLFSGAISVISGRRLLENLSFYQFHIGGTASVFVGIFMILIGRGLKSKTRTSWYFTVFLITASLFSILNLSIEAKLALAAILISLIYGVAGTLLLENQFNPPIRDIYTAVYYTVAVLTTLGFGDILPVTNTSRLFTASIGVLGIASFLGAITTFLGPVM